MVKTHPLDRHLGNQVKKTYGEFIIIWKMFMLNVRFCLKAALKVVCAVRSGEAK